MTEDQISKLEKHVSISTVLREILSVIEARAEPCLYLVPSEEGDVNTAMAGGWPEMPCNMDWPRNEQGFFPFIAWIDLDQVTAMLPGFTGSGRWLLFEEPNSGGPKSARIISNGTSVEQRTMSDAESWIQDGISELLDGEPYEPQPLKFVKGLSICFEDDEACHDYYDELHAMVPEDSVGQIGGFCGPDDDGMRTGVYIAMQGHSALNACDPRFAEMDPDQLPQPTVHQEPTINLDLSGILKRYQQMAQIFEDYLTIWQERAKARDKKWPLEVSNTIRKLIAVIREKETQARQDFRELAQISNQVQKSLDKLQQLDQGKTQFAIDWVKSIPEYEGWLSNPKMPQRGSEPYQSLAALCDQIGSAERSGDSSLLEQVQNLATRLGQCDKEFSWFLWNDFLGRYCYRVLFNQIADFNRQRWQRPEAEALAKIQAGLEWKKSLRPGQSDEESKKIKLALALGEASNWCWGDGAHRLYFASESDLARGDFTRIVEGFDQS